MTTEQYQFKQYERVTYSDDFEYDFSAGVEIQPTVDGTMLCLHKVGDEVVVRTKNSDAYKSYWVKKFIFGNLFDQILEKMGKKKEDIAEENRVFYFLLCHPRVRHVTRVEEPKLYHMSTFNTETNEWESFRLEGFETIANIKVESREVFNEMIRNSRTGYLVGDNFVMSEFYAKAFELRGGVPDIEYRVFQMVKNNRMVEFLEYFPDLERMANYYKRKFTNFCRYVHRTYVNIKIKNQVEGYLPGKGTRQLLNTIYEEHGVDKYVSYKMVQNHIRNYSDGYIYKLLLV